MIPVEPVLHEGAHLVVFGKDQPEYIPLPASVDDAGLVMTEWVPTADDLKVLSTGGKVRLWIWKGVVHTCLKCNNQDPALLCPVSIEAVA